ncbi:MAG TPA: TonB-dependent receptor [Thermoanaerobaculia bacterium]|jgi:iron complex outermembrane receptor protein|nr:TonB-dependent receptor [Thermoanaerobaculia bacterium]
MHRAPLTLFLLLLAATTTAALGQETATPLDDLLNARINAAAKYEQPVRDVPASVTIITAEEIERYGFETLTDALRSIRGLYTSYDRNYSNLGVRGFSRLSDYNNRLLVLIDGHPLNEPVFGSAGVGTDLVVDLYAVERIEFVRGPSSVMYGTGAMFGVVNVVMKRGDGTPTASATARSGSGGVRSGSANGTAAIGGTDIAISGLWRSEAGKNLYFPEFATKGSDGIARGRDYDRSGGVMAHITRGGFEATLHYGTRTKGVPGASYDTKFNEDEWTIDRRKFIDLSYERALTPRLRMAVRSYWDRYDYDGRYPTSPVLLDDCLGEKLALETRLAWDVRSNDRLTVGIEATNATRAEYRYRGNGALSLEGPFKTIAGYVQNEYQPASNLSVTAGLRIEHNSAVGHSFNPRLAVVFNPFSSSTMKVLYGQAYRAPDVYELEAFGHGVSNGLRPEKVRTLELVVEQKLSSSFAMFASVFANKAEGLIDIVAFDGTTQQYQNDPKAQHGNGAEMQIDYRAPAGLWAYASWSVVHVADDDAGEIIANTPRNLFHFGASTNPEARLHAGIDLDYETSRATVDRGRTSPFLVANATSSFALTNHLRAGLTVRNLFDRHYSTPVGAEFRSSSMQQDGRTIDVMLHVTK